jgi:hypothetical protein
MPWRGRCRAGSTRRLRGRLAVWGGCTANWAKAGLRSSVGRAGVCPVLRGCRMLGRTQRVTAPTGLPKVMESAVGRAREFPQKRGLDRARRALRRCCLDRAPTVGGARARRALRCSGWGDTACVPPSPPGWVRVMGCACVQQVVEVAWAGRKQKGKRGAATRAQPSPAAPQGRQSAPTRSPPGSDGGGVSWCVFVGGAAGGGGARGRDGRVSRRGSRRRSRGGADAAAEARSAPASGGTARWQCQLMRSCTVSAPLHGKAGFSRQRDRRSAAGGCQIGRADPCLALRGLPARARSPYISLTHLSGRFPPIHCALGCPALRSSRAAGWVVQDMFVGVGERFQLTTHNRNCL